MRVNDEGDTMADAAMGAQIVRVRLKEGKSGLFIATSPDLKGLLVAEKTVDALERAIPPAIAEMYAACGERVVVTWINNPADPQRSFVAFPAELARRALSEQSAVI